MKDSLSLSVSYFLTWEYLTWTWGSVWLHGWLWWQTLLLSYHFMPWITFGTWKELNIHSNPIHKLLQMINIRLELMYLIHISLICKWPKIGNMELNGISQRLPGAMDGLGKRAPSRPEDKEQVEAWLMCENRVILFNWPFGLRGTVISSSYYPEALPGSVQF
jgi:hypothetical protein